MAGPEKTNGDEVAEQRRIRRNRQQNLRRGRGFTHGGLRPGSGRKPTCKCGECYNCKRRAIARRAYDKKRALSYTRVSDEELERRMIEKFKSKGWDE